MTKDMTKGNPFKLILAFSIPLLLGNIFQQFYNMVDSIIVGQFIGEEALAAVGSTGAMVFLVIGFCMGIASGFGVLVSQSFGARDEKRLRRYVSVALISSLGLTVALTSLMMVTTMPLLRLMKTPENIIEDAYAYLIVIYAGLGATLYYNVLACILRGVGDSKTPLYFLGLSSVLNVVLDLLFVVVMHSGVAGAAYATIISQGISAVLCLFYMFHKFPMLRLRKGDWEFDWSTASQLFRVGLPMALQFSITALGVMVLQSAINDFGSTVVASYTAASKVENLSTQVMITLGTAMATYCGQNLGAGRFDRIKAGVNKAYLMVILATGLAVLISAVFGKYIVGWFLPNPSEEVVAYALQYLNMVSYFYFILAILFLFRNVLQGLGNSIVPMFCGVAEMAVRIFVAFALAGRMGYLAICLASPLAWVAAGVPLFVCYYIQIRNPERWFLNKR